MFNLDHVESDGRLLFEEVVKMDLEGMVCKRKDSPYKVTEKPSRYWIKMKNIQPVGRPRRIKSNSSTASE